MEVCVTYIIYIKVVAQSKIQISSETIKFSEPSI